MARAIAGTLLLIGGGLLPWHLATREETLPPVAGSLWGRVCDQAYRPIAFATVRLSVGDELLEVTHTNEYGCFVLSYSAPGGTSLTLEARGRGYEPGRCFIRAGEGSPVRLEMSGHHCLTLTLRHTDGHPAPGYHVVVTASPPRPGRPGPRGGELLRRRDVPDSSTTLSLLHPVVDLVILRPNYPPVRMDDVDVTGGSFVSPRQLDIRLERGATVHGHVRVPGDWTPVYLKIAVIPWPRSGASGQAELRGYQNARVTVRRERWPFVIHGLEPGDYEVAAVRDNGDFLSGPVTVAVDGVESVGPIELVCGDPAPVAVKVVFGRAQTGAYVALAREPPGRADAEPLPWIPDSSTDVFARAVFSSVPPGRYRARVRLINSLGTVRWENRLVDRQLRRLFAEVRDLASGIDLVIDVEARRPQTFTLDASHCLDGYVEWLERTGRDRIRGKIRALTVEFSRTLPDELERVGITPAELPYYRIEASLLAIEDMVAKDDSALSHLEPPLVTALRARDVCGICEALLEY